MSLFRKNHMRCDYVDYTDKAALASPPFPVRQIPARDLRRGMTFVAAPDSWCGPTVCCGHWPVIVDDPRYRECGEGGEPCVYWTTDEPGDDDGDRSPHYWTLAGVLLTIAA